MPINTSTETAANTLLQRFSPPSWTSVRVRSAAALEPLGVWALLVICLAACALILLLPAESFVTDLVYRAF
jgi:hypothetical protein